MKTDRELLELAAKAAGMGGWRFTGTCMVRMIDPTRPNNTGSIGKEWNPLTDDGDALRLAARLGMVIDVRYKKPESSRYNRVTYWITPSNGLEITFGDAELDQMAATRRAITRAAAAIGEAM